MRRPLAVVLVLALLLVGCTKKGDAPADSAGPPAPAPEALALFEAAGDGATMVVALQPGRWAEAAPVLATLLEGSDAAPLVEALRAPDLATGLTRLAGTLLGRAATPPVPGLDPSRPIVLGLFTPAVGDVALASRALLPYLPTGGVTGLHHRVLLPATDPTGAATALSALAIALGAPAAPGGPSLHLFEGGYVGFVAEKDRVRVELLTHDRRAFPDEAARVAAFRAELASAPAPVSLPRTPALLFAASRPDLLVVYLRPWQLRDLGSQLGAIMVARALENVSPEQSATLMAMGLSEVSNGYLLMSPLGAEADDLALAVDVRPEGIALASVTSLTEQGAKVYAVAAGGRLPPAVTGGLLSFWTRLDVPAALAAASVPPAVAVARSASELAQAFQECGFACVWYVPLRAPFGFAKAVTTLAPIATAGRLPVGAALAITDLGGEGRHAVPAGGVALVYPESADTSWIAIGVAGLRDVFDDARPPVTEEIVRAGAKTVLVTTFGARPFAADPVAAPDGALAGLELDVGGLARGLLRGDEVPSVLLSLGRMRLLAGVDGRAYSVVGTVALAASTATDGRREAPLPALPRGLSHGLAWESPGAKAAATKGARCLEDVTRSMREGFSALAGAPPEQRAYLFGQAVEEARVPLACAIAEPDTKEIALRTRGLMGVAVAEGFLTEWRLDGALAALRRACDEGHAEACRRATVLAESPPPTLASIAADCGRPTDVPYASVTAIRADGPLPNAPADEAPLALAIAPDVPAERVAAAAEALSGGRLRTAELIVRGRFGPPRALLVALAPASVDPVLPPAASLFAPPGPREDRPLARPGILAALAEGEGSSGPAAAEPLVVAERAADGSVTVRGGREPEAVLAAGSGDEWATTVREAVASRGLGLAPPPVHVTGAPGVTFGQLAELVAVLACDPRREAPAVRLGRAPAPTVGLGTGSLSGIRGEMQGALAGNEAGRPVGSSTPGEPEVSSGLPREIIQQVVRRHLGAVKYCYRRALLAHPACAGTVRVAFTIDKEGKVPEASLVESTVTCPEVAECVVARVRMWRFPAPDGDSIVRVTYPFVFAPTPPAAP